MSKKVLIFSVLIVIVFGGLTLVAFWKWVGASFVENVPAAASKLLASLIVITLFVERSLAAVNAVIFQPKKRELEAEARALAILDSTERNVRRNEIVDVQKKLATIAGYEDKNRVVLGFTFALLVSAAGVRSLSSLLQIDPVNGTGGLEDEFQRYLAHLVDIFLTAGLIAGGSDGLAKLLQIIKLGMTQPPKPIR